MSGSRGLTNLYRAAVWLLVVSSAATLTGRLGQVQSASGLTPFMSANDRSRWSTVRSLVDHGTYVLDDVIFHEPPPEDDGRLRLPKLQRDPDWYSIDLVKHRGVDGREHYYSSKPPLLATLVAGEYWVVQRLTGASLATQPFYVARVLLFFTNILPLAAAWWLLSRMLDGWHPAFCRSLDSLAEQPQAWTSFWARLFVMAAATWGTLLSPMAVTLNNHIPAAIAACLTLAALLRIWRDDRAATGWYAVAGVAAAFCAANELPALSLTAAAAGCAALRDPKRTIVGFVPGAAAVAIAAIGTTFIAHSTWVPPYAHRSDGPIVARLPADMSLAPDADSVRPNAAVREALAREEIPLSEQATQRAAGEGRWTLFDPTNHHRWAIVKTNDGGECRAWNNWYDFEGTYWRPDRLRGVDRGESSRVTYAFHALVGHHGILSLTPLWLLSVGGLVLLWRSGDSVARGLAFLVAGLTLVCLAFYISRPLIDRNYGGVSCGLRWMFWFIPLWLLTLAPCVERLATSRWGRAFALALLAASIFSAAWNATRPWSHPWLYDYWQQLGWLSQ